MHFEPGKFCDESSVRDRAADEGVGSGTDKTDALLEKA